MESAKLAWIVAALVVGALAAVPLRADISGSVRDLDTGAPLAGARVHLQADPLSPVATSAADGSFTLVVSPVGPVVVTAALPYEHQAADNWTTAGTLAVDGASGVEIHLRRLPVADDPQYPTQLPLVDSCESCHHDQVEQWSASPHAGAGADVWVLDLLAGTGTPGGGAGYVFRDLHEADETGFCATCHTPMADVFDPGNVFMDEVTQPPALDGVSCIACHQIAHVNQSVNGLHHLGNASYRFPDGGTFPTHQYVWGPLDDVSFAGMRASAQPIFAESLLCASCHEYTNPATGAPGQSTYSEWLASPYAVAGPGYRGCQHCHMAEADGPGTIATVGSDVVRPSEQRHDHQVVGATADSLAAALSLTLEAHQVGGLLRVRCEVGNVGAGHSFPTGVSIRNALLLIEATADGQPLAQVAGPSVPFWADDDLPGQQEGDHAGAPGKGFARVLEGRINGVGETVRPVLFIDAEGVWSDTAIAAGATDVTEVDLALPGAVEDGDVAVVSARLLYRRAWRALAVTKGWATTPDGGPVEVEVAAASSTVALSMAEQAVPVPATGPLGGALLAAAIAASALLLLRRTWGG